MQMQCANQSTGSFPRLLASTRPPFAFCISHIVSPHFALRSAESRAPCVSCAGPNVLPEQNIAPINIANAAVAVPLNIQSILEYPEYPENPESLKLIARLAQAYSNKGGGA